MSQETLVTNTWVSRESQPQDPQEHAFFFLEAQEVLKMQVNSVKATDIHAEAIKALKALKKPKEVQPKLPKDPNRKFHWLASAHTKLVD